MSDLVGNPEDRFSQNEAQIMAMKACHTDSQLFACVKERNEAASKTFEAINVNKVQNAEIDFLFSTCMAAGSLFIA